MSRVVSLLVATQGLQCTDYHYVTSKFDGRINDPSHEVSRRSTTR